MQGRADPDHVGDRVQRPYLVEVDRLGRHVMDVRLHLSQPGEHRRGAVPYRCREFRRGEEVTDAAPRSVRRIADQNPNVDLDRSESGPGHRFGLQPDGFRYDRVDGSLHHLEVGAGVH
jgi:hypothetical protein